MKKKKEIFYFSVDVQWKPCWWARKMNFEWIIRIMTLQFAIIDNYWRVIIGFSTRKNFKIFFYSIIIIIFIATTRRARILSDTMNAWYLLVCWTQCFAIDGDIFEFLLRTTCPIVDKIFIWIIWTEATRQL